MIIRDKDEEPCDTVVLNSSYCVGISQDFTGKRKCAYLVACSSKPLMHSNSFDS